MNGSFTKTNVHVYSLSCPLTDFCYFAYYQYCHCSIAKLYLYVKVHIFCILELLSIKAHTRIHHTVLHIPLTRAVDGGQSNLLSLRVNWSRGGNYRGVWLSDW